ncbi:hypothetical protein [Pseudodesulfovibrio sediminis]|uniref:Uncharacterized protein n=1 Tax=Pseudodesulfovibrio sediminis TaxID=2810563 RepID=A0ABN6ENM5_9BACT|nr:hypothetical protein [Pseudodesulfovibrio sediminis]BCS87867.1 hypothetical protein PSDVSF_11090 [Pseudodesulfovibrio sediminis]
MSESYLEKALLKLARQINAYDEASLMSLWDKYAEKVRHFEPTKRWEESVLVFNLIQSIRLKNQLFNYNWAQSRMPDDAPHEIDLAALTVPEKVSSVPDGKEGEEDAKDGVAEKPDRRGKLLTLTPKKTK